MHLKISGHQVALFQHPHTLHPPTVVQRGEGSAKVYYIYWDKIKFKSASFKVGSYSFSEGLSQINQSLLQCSWLKAL